MALHLNSVGSVRPVVGWRLRAHRHLDAAEIIVVVRGRLAVQIRGQLLLAVAGESLLYPPGEPHEERADGDEPIETIFLNWRPEQANDPSNWPLKVADPHGRLEYLARWLLERHARRRSGDRLIGPMFETFLAAYRECAAGHEDPLLARVRRFVQANLAERLRLDDLAAEAGMSRFHFVRAFARPAGQTPMRFVRALRVEAARTLLLSSPLSLRAIAGQVGLGDEYHLSRVFLEVTGKRPSQLRRTLTRRVAFQRAVSPR